MGRGLQRDAVLSVLSGKDAVAAWTDSANLFKQRLSAVAPVAARANAVYDDLVGTHQTEQGQITLRRDTHGRMLV
jgi:hypothetical protein